MAPSLDRVRAKLARAKTQADALDIEISGSVGVRVPGLYTLVPNLDLEAGKCYMRLEKRGELPLREWEAELGGIVHDLRSSLDQLAYQLALLNGTDEDTLRGSEFPIFLDADLFYKRGKGGGVHKIRGLDPSDAGIIEGLQPFDFPEHPLWVLQQLSNGDKHRLGVLFDDAVGLPLMRGPFWQDLRVVGEQWKRRYEPGEIAATYSIVQTGPNPKVELEFTPTIAISVDEGIGRAARHLSQVIPQLLKATEGVVHTFEPRFA